MKKTLLSGFTFLLLVLFLTSCSRVSEFSIAKRHYRSGYYIECSSTKKLTSPVEAVSPPAQAIYAKENKANSPQVAVVTTDRLSSDNTASNAFTQSKESSSPISFKNSAKGNLHSIVPEQEQIVPVQKVNRILENKNLKLIARRDGGGGHSILWWVIVILLILVLISWLSNGFLGGLIYLLLLIALILLILRLLGMM